MMCFRNVSVRRNVRGKGGEGGRACHMHRQVIGDGIVTARAAKLSARQSNLGINKHVSAMKIGGGGGGGDLACNTDRQKFLSYLLGPGRASPFCPRPSFAPWRRHSWPACHPWHLSLWAWPAFPAAHRHLSLWACPAFAAAHRHEQPIGGLTGRLTGKWMPHCLWLLDHD